MPRVRLRSLNDFAEWRLAARALLLAGTRPDDVVWDDPASAADLFSEPEDRPADIAARAVGVVPPRFLELAEIAVCHREPIRFGLLYRLLFRLQKDRDLIGARSDPDVSKLYRLVSEVRRESGRLRSVIEARHEDRVAIWFEPEHYVLERTASHLVRTVRGQWAILTPYRCAAWDGARLVFGRGARRQDAPRASGPADAWAAYFAAIFGGGVVLDLRGNSPPSPDIPPQPIMEAGMASHIDTAVSAHAARPRRADADEATEIVSLAAARAAVQGCRRCPLFEHATQAVFGEGPRTAEVMFVGEQPGDQEDLAGKPFVGPAGGVLDRALEAVGIDRRRIYVTNAVKHFKFEPRGKKRIHQKPNAGEIKACRFWLDLERRFVHPQVIVAMGATAIHGVLGKSASIRSLRGEPLRLPEGEWLVATIHPSYLLRMPDRDAIEEQRRQFVADLRSAKALVEKASAA